MVKIVNRAEFMAMDGIVLHRKYEPCIFGELGVKVSTIKDVGGEPIDYVTIGTEQIDDSNFNEVHEFLCGDALNGVSFRFEYESTSRDGLYDDDQMYAIYDDDDIDQLIAFLESCKTKGE